MLFSWKNGGGKKKNHVHYFQPMRDSEATTIVNWEHVIVVVCCLLWMQSIRMPLPVQQQPSFSVLISGCQATMIGLWPTSLAVQQIVFGRLSWLLFQDTSIGPLFVFPVYMSIVGKGPCSSSPLSAESYYLGYTRNSSRMQAHCHL